MADVDVDDAHLWAHSALRHAELAAQQLAHFRNPWWAPPWRDLIPDDEAHPPSDSAAGRPLLPSDPPPEKEGIGDVTWGSRGKRSRQIGVKGGRWAAGSPETPLDFLAGSGFASGSGSGSASSTSGGDDGSSSPEKAKKGARPGEPFAAVAGDGRHQTKVVAAQRAPLVFRFPGGKSIRRQGKKKTIIELQQEEKLLMEEMAMLNKEVESKRRAYEASLAENKRLKSLLVNVQSQEAPTTAAITFEKVHAQQIQTRGESSAAPSRGVPFILPDLNEPLSENLD